MEMIKIRLMGEREEIKIIIENISHIKPAHCRRGEGVPVRSQRSRQDHADVHAGRAGDAIV